MIKKFLAVLAVAVALPLCTSSFTAQAQTKFGIVSVETVMRDLPDMASAQKELDGVSKKYNREDSILKAEMQIKYDELQKLAQDNSTPDNIKERRMQELQDMSNKYQQFLQNAQQDLQRQQEILMAPIQQKVVNAIKAVGDAGGYTLIFPAELPAFAGKDVVDVTPDVRKHLGLK